MAKNPTAKAALKIRGRQTHRHREETGKRRKLLCLCEIVHIYFMEITKDYKNCTITNEVILQVKKVFLRNFLAKSGGNYYN